MKKVILSLILIGAIITGIVTVSNKIVENKLEQAEEERLAHIDKYSLDLPYIVNLVDDLGGNNLQLNWQEIIAIVAVNLDNYVSTMTEQQISEVASLFIKGDVIRSFEVVLSQLYQDEDSRQLARQYLEDLKEYGYVPYKLVESSREMQFINSIKQSAIDNYKQYNILPSITIAQAILESNWGESELAQVANNLFGIKVGVGWTGDVVTFKTNEYYDTIVLDEFRKYSNVSDSITDHAAFLVANPRYSNAGVFDKLTYETQAIALQEAGYSTATDEAGNKTYAKMLGEMIRQYNLQLIDHEVKH